MCCWSSGSGWGVRRGSSAARETAAALLLGIAGEAPQARQGLAARSRHAVASTTRAPGPDSQPAFFPITLPSEGPQTALNGESSGEDVVPPRAHQIAIGRQSRFLGGAGGGWGLRSVGRPRPRPRRLSTSVSPGTV